MKEHCCIDCGKVIEWFEGYLCYDCWMKYRDSLDRIDGQCYTNTEESDGYDGSWDNAVKVLEK